MARPRGTTPAAAAGSSAGRGRPRPCLRSKLRHTARVASLQASSLASKLGTVQAWRARHRLVEPPCHPYRNSAAASRTVCSRMWRAIIDASGELRLCTPPRFKWCSRLSSINAQWSRAGPSSPICMCARARRCHEQEAWQPLQLSPLAQPTPSARCVSDTCQAQPVSPAMPGVLCSARWPPGAPRNRAQRMPPPAPPAPQSSPPLSLASAAAQNGCKGRDQPCM